MERDPNTVAYELCGQIDALMALAAGLGGRRTETLTGDQLYSLLLSLQDRAEEIRTLTDGPPTQPAAGGESPPPGSSPGASAQPEPPAAGETDDVVRLLRPKAA